MQIKFRSIQKALLYLAALIICGSLGFILGDYLNLKFPEPETIRDFEFRGGITYSGGDYEKAISDVVINNQDDYSDEEMLQMVYDYYILMNEKPDEVTFNFYYSAGALHRDDSYLSHTFYAEPDEPDSAP